VLESQSIYVSQCLDKIQSEIIVLRLVAGHPFIASFFGMFEVQALNLIVLGDLSRQTHIAHCVRRTNACS
jgi:hypothetical protein